MIAVQPQSCVCELEDVDREGVAGLGASTADRAGERVDAVGVEAGDSAAVESGPICLSLISRVSRTTVSPSAT